MHAVNTPAIHTNPVFINASHILLGITLLEIPRRGIEKCGVTVQ
jgi:hypothetical protein